METVIQSLLTAFLVTYVSIPVILFWAGSHHLFDKREQRKLHTAEIPRLGGVALFLGLCFAFAVWLYPAIPAQFWYFILGAAFVFAIGLMDDIKTIPAESKFLGLVVASVIVVGDADLRICGFSGMTSMPLVGSGAGVLIVAAGFVLVSTAFNFIDGIDCLAGGLGLLSTAAFSVLFWAGGDPFYASLAAALAGTLMAFLRFNKSPALIFMGDAGALTLGFVLAGFCFRYLHISGSLNYPGHATWSPIVVIAIVGVPVLDAIRVLLFRLVKRRNPFGPDQCHIHHLLLRMRWSHLQVALLLVSCNAVFIVLALLARRISFVYPSLLILFMGIALSFLVSLKPHRTKRVTAKGA